MMYGIIAVLAVLVLVLFFVNDKKIKGAVLSLGMMAIAVMFFLHYLKMVSFSGPVLALGLSVVAILVFAVATAYSFLKK